MTFALPSLVAAELYRVTRQRSNWLLPVVPIAGLVVLTTLTATNQSLTDQGGKSVLGLARTLTDTAALTLAMTLGAPLLLVASRVAAHDYTYGTVRMLVGGGGDRELQLASKVVATLIVALVGMALALSLAIAAVALASPTLTTHVRTLPPTYWHELALDIAAVGVSLLACVLLGTAASTLSRSLVAGMTAAMVWMPAENALTGLLAFFASMSGSGVFGKATGWLLTPNLNHLIQALQPWRSTVEMLARPVGESPSNPVGSVGAAQCLTVIATWCAAFVMASIVGSGVRVDIQE